MTETAGSSRANIVLSLDVGTTTVKAILISKEGIILGRSHEKVYEMLNASRSVIHFYIGKQIS